VNECQCNSRVKNISLGFGSQYKRLSLCTFEKGMGRYDKFIADRHYLEPNISATGGLPITVQRFYQSNIPTVVIGSNS